MNTDRSERDLSKQSCSPKDGGRFANGADTGEHSGWDDGQESVHSVSAHDPRPPAQSSNGEVGHPRDAASNGVPTCLESGSTEGLEGSFYRNGSSQHAQEHEPGNTPSSYRQASSSRELTVSGGGDHPGSTMDRGEILSGKGDDVPPDEWEASEIIGEEVQDGVQYYMVAWMPTLEPEGNLGHMKELIEEWKAKVRALSEKKRTGSGIKKPGHGSKYRVEKGRAGSGGAQRSRGARQGKL